MTYQAQLRWLSGVNMAAGIWLIISPWIFGYANGSAFHWNDLAVGIAVLVLAVIRVVVARSTWASWLSVLLGFWLMATGYFALTGSISAAGANTAVLGIVVTCASFASALTPLSRSRSY